MVWVTPMCYTPLVYVDPKVQPPLFKQDVTKHPRSYKTCQSDTIATFSKRPNAPRDKLSLPWQLGNIHIKESTSMLWCNTSRSKAGQFLHAMLKQLCQFIYCTEVFVPCQQNCTDTVLGTLSNGLTLILRNINTSLSILTKSTSMRHNNQHALLHQIQQI